MNNRKPLVIIALAVLLCGLLAFRGATAVPTPGEADSSRNADDEKKGGFDPLYVMIPITVLVLGFAVFTFVKEEKKRR